MMLSSEEPWSIMRTLTPAFAMAEKTRAEVPTLRLMPWPTTAMSEMRSKTRIWSGWTASLISEMICSSTPFGRCAPSMMKDMVSMPVGMCSKETPWFSSTVRILRAKPISRFMSDFSTKMTVKFFLPATPVTVLPEKRYLEVGMMSVPSSSGRKVFLMRMGISASRTGKMDSLWRTFAPM